MKPGDKVHFILFEGCNVIDYENGIVKSVDYLNAFVVYRCNNDWDNFMNYTSEKTLIDNLREGWIETIENPFDIALNYRNSVSQIKPKE